MSAMSKEGKTKNPEKIYNNKTVLTSDACCMLFSCQLGIKECHLVLSLILLLFLKERIKQRKNQSLTYFLCVL